MRRITLQRVGGLLLVFSSSMMLPSMLIGMLDHDGTERAFLWSAIILLVAGISLWWPYRNTQTNIRLRDGFVLVVMAWLTVGLSGALPLAILRPESITVIDAIFEALSGLTTTGATTLVSLDTLPASVLFYRHLLQWFGGMGIIVLAVAVLPMLRIGGMQLYRAETPGPMKDNKLTPRVTETAKALWLIYLGLTIMCCLAYWLAGMSLFDALCHAFSTVAIGGFSTHDLSIGYFNSPLIESVAMVFMVLAGMNFALHFLAWRRTSTQPYFNDPEVRVYIIMLVLFGLITSLALLVAQTYPDIGSAFRYGLFQAVSAMTTTGYTTASFYTWPGMLPVLLIMLAFVGGCAGSTAGGMKVIRVILLYKQAVREIHHLIHPNAVVPIKLGGSPMSGKVVFAVWGFFFLYVASFCLMSLLLTATGMDPVTAFSAVGACLTNLGPALGAAGPHYADVNAFAKLVLSLAMLLGRLEIFTLLVLFTPAFWRD